MASLSGGLPCGLEADDRGQATLMTLQEMRAGDALGATGGDGDTPLQEAIGTQLADSRALLESVQVDCDPCSFGAVLIRFCRSTLLHA